MKLSRRLFSYGGVVRRSKFSSSLPSCLNNVYSKLTRFFIVHFSLRNSSLPDKYILLICVILVDIFDRSLIKSDCNLGGIGGDCVSYKCAGI